MDCHGLNKSIKCIFPLEVKCRFYSTQCLISYSIHPHQWRYDPHDSTATKPNPGMLSDTHAISETKYELQSQGIQKGHCALLVERMHGWNWQRQDRTCPEVSGRYFDGFFLSVCKRAKWRL